ncbi:MAG TPA: porin [Desulfosalsimonadaceae bacterium]|nr:porin [Desulfosalsimonadaceae bacterium]
MNGKPFLRRPLLPFMGLLLIIPVLLFTQISLAKTGLAAIPEPGTELLQPIETGSLKFRLGGVLQTEYGYYAEDERSDNRFNIRRAQVELSGRMQNWLRLNFEYELKDDVSDHLLDTYAEIRFRGHGLRLGHFKKPFSLEQVTEERALYFAERSIGYSLVPRRDIGVMLHGAFANNAVGYGLGLFNTEGTDSGASRNEHDDPAVIGRLILAPFAGADNPWLNSFQFGGSAAYARMNLSDLKLLVKSTGMIDTNRNLYVLSHDTKFGVLQDIGDRYRYGAEAAWAFKSLALQGEYIRLEYTDLKPAGQPAKDASFSAWYVSGLYFLTGEKPAYESHRLHPICPVQAFDPKNGNYGAFGIGARVEHFSGDEDWINPEANVSSEEADAFSISVVWLPFAMHKVMLDFSRTELSDPIKVRVLPDGSIDYIDDENTVTIRYSIDF